MDCHPRLTEELMPELVDRLLGGAVWGVLPPDDETRLGILRQKSVGGPPVAEDVLKYLARNLRGNVRELEGAVNGVRHFARVTGRPVDQPLVREALGDLLRHTVRSVTVADVDAAVCTVLRLSSGTLQSKARSWAVSHPRMLAIYLARKHTAATYGEIAKHFGGEDAQHGGGGREEGPRVASEGRAAGPGRPRVAGEGPRRPGRAGDDAVAARPSPGGHRARELRSTLGGVARQPVPV